MDVTDLESAIYNGHRAGTSLAGRDVLRRIAYYITEPMAAKECLSYYYTRFIACCQYMYRDLIQGLSERAVRSLIGNGTP